jgi:hypothetical protein
MRKESSSSDRSPYRKAPVDTRMGLNKPVCVEISSEVWHALDAMARAGNKTKSALLRPVIADFVATNRKRQEAQ